jgi:histidine triad (HIT) family protein
MQEPSIFTRIIKGELPTHRIYEDDRVIAFMDPHPLNAGHVLVVPKKQIDQIWDLSDDDYEYLWKIANKIGKHIREVIKPPRVGIIVEGFGVPHTHIHLIPIYYSNDLQRADKLSPDDKTLAEMAARLNM